MYRSSITTMPDETAKLASIPLRLQLAGRLRNMGKLRTWYMAVAEAITNSMESIQDSGRKGEIEIVLKRSNDLLTKGGAVAPIANVVIRDNGIGFNEKNYTSFITPDSLHKLQRGGKGLGRLMCLQAFTNVHVLSSCEENGTWKDVEILLKLESPELSGYSKESTAQNHKTEVHLNGLRHDHVTGGAADFETILSWLKEHFLPALVSKPDWLSAMTLIDGAKKIDLVASIQSSSVWADTFKIGSYEFSAKCYSIETGSRTDTVQFVAGARIVHANTRPLEFYIPHLDSISSQKSHVLLVHSPYFDEHVNDARNGVSFSEEESTTPLEISAPKFREELGTILQKHLKERLAASAAAFQIRIKELVAKEAPSYQPLLLSYFTSKEFLNVSKSARDEEILSSLDIFKRRETGRIQKENKRIAKIKVRDDEYWKSAQSLASAIEIQKKVALAEYVSFRKIILDQLEEIINAKDDGTAHLESAIHNLVFPQKTDTESHPGVDHQLWILDERLESHDYLASDKPMTKGNGDRPDLLIALDHPGAFASEPSSVAAGYERIVLVEFKRALKDLATVPTDELPHRQMMRYAAQIKAGEAKLKKSGRPIKTSPNVRFYLYSICELSPTLLERLTNDEQFIPSPTGDGAFAVNGKGAYYLEYISISKFLEDAKVRNQAFFTRLGI